jgi:hypothetical protein
MAPTTTKANVIIAYDSNNNVIRPITTYAGKILYKFTEGNSRISIPFYVLVNYFIVGGGSRGEAASLGTATGNILTSTSGGKNGKGGVGGQVVQGQTGFNEGIYSIVVGGANTYGSNLDNSTTISNNIVAKGSGDSTLRSTGASAGLLAIDANYNNQKAGTNGITGTVFTLDGLTYGDGGGGGALIRAGTSGVTLATGGGGGGGRGAGRGLAGTTRVNNELATHAENNRGGGGGGGALQAFEVPQGSHQAYGSPGNGAAGVAFLWVNSNYSLTTTTTTKPATRTA